MGYEQTELCECHADLRISNTFNSDDVNLFQALIAYSNDATTQLSFSDFYQQRINSGSSVSLIQSIPSHLNKDYVTSRKPCLDFDQSTTLNSVDTTVYGAFQAWNDSRGTSDLQGLASEHQEFVYYCRTLIEQGLIDLTINFDDVILPSLPNQDFLLTSTGKIDKVPCEGIYDESNSLFATQVDSWTDLFIASAPGTRAYYDWDGNGSNYYRTTGLCKVYRKTNESDLQDYGLIEPPFDLLKNRNWDEDYIPMGSDTILGGRTIAIHANYVAVASKYNDAGVVYIYFNNGEGNYELKHEVIINGDFTNHLPIIELSAGYLFVSDPLSNPKINVYKIVDLQEYDPDSISTETTPTVTTTTLEPISSDAGDNTILSGFGSLHSDNTTNNTLIAGMPQGDVLVSGFSDQKIDCGFVVVFSLVNGDWITTAELIPPDIERYATDLSGYGEDTADIQFGYAVHTANNKILIGSPKAYKSYKDRREGIVYVFSKLQTGAWTYETSIENDDAKTSTLNKTTGTWEFGRGVALDSESNAWILESISERKTYVSEFVSDQGNPPEYSATQNRVFEVADQPVGGHIAVGDSTLVFGANGYFEGVLTS